MAFAVLLPSGGVACEETMRRWPVHSDRSRVWNAAPSSGYANVYRSVESPRYAHRRAFLSATWPDTYPNTYAEPNTCPNSYAKPDTYPNTYADEGGNNRTTHRSRVRQARRRADRLSG